MVGPTHRPPPAGALTTVACTAMIAAVVGLASVVPCAWNLDWSPGVAFIVAATVYVGVALLVAYALARSPYGSSRIFDSLVMVNAVVAPLCVLGLALVARWTHVTVKSTGRVQWIHWFPLWLAG